MGMRLIIFLFALLLLSSESFSHPVIKVAAIDWCPQLCPQDQNKKGYLLEMMEKLFSNSKYRMKVSFYPWSRAIHLVNNGTYDVLLSPAKEEAPKLVYHKDPLAKQVHCFWKLKDSDWNFKGFDRLKDDKIIIYQDHSLKSLKNKNAMEIPHSETFLDQSLLLLKKKRAKALIFTSNTVRRYINEKKVKDLVQGK